MSILKKIILIAAILVVAVLNVFIYWNQHLYYKAYEIGDTEQRIEVLEKAARFYPLNDLVYYELGKSYHDLGINSLGEEGRSSVHLQKSISHFDSSIRINPSSYFAHFYLAQSLYNQSFDSPSLEDEAHLQYKKAANLAGQNSEIFFEVGKVYLSQWPLLSEQDRDYTVEILNKIINRRERERLRILLNLWQINVDDYEVMAKILPEDSKIYREYAEFLGEKSLSIEERQRFLANAEFLEFQKASDAYEAGEYDLFYYRPKEAQNHFQSCLNILKKIRFYQNLVAPQKQIDSSEYDDLHKQALLNQVKSILEQGQNIKNVEDSLWEYLAREDKAADINKLKAYLNDWGLIGESIESKIDDMGRLAFQLHFSLKQGNYRENMRIGRNLLQNLFVIPEGMEDQFVKILEIVGESFQKVDFIYDSNDFYSRALELDPNNLEILVKLRGNYERLRAAQEVREINSQIGEIISPRELDVNRSISRGQTFRQNMIFDGQEINLDLLFGEREGDRSPLITVLFNGRVAWEDYVEGDLVSFRVDTKVGGNVLEVVPVNRGEKLMKIFYRGE